MGRKQNRTKPSTSTPPPSTVNRTSSPTPPPSDDTTATDRALDILRRGSHAKALKIVKEQLSKNKNSPVLHRVNGEIHFELANVIGDSAAKLKHVNNAAESAQRATTLSPNSLSYAHFYVLTLIELCKEKKEYDKVIQECDRALSIENPSDSLNDTLFEKSENESLESRIESLKEEIRNFKKVMNVIKILDVDGVEERVKFRRNVKDQSKTDSELKELITKNEKKVNELEKKIEEVKILRRKLDLDLDFGECLEGSRFREMRKLEGLEKRSVANVRKTERMRKYWNERMSDESKKRLLRVRIDELEQHFDKNDAAREVLNEAIGYAKEKGKWRFWECRSCGKKFDASDVGMEHYEKEHVGAFPGKFKYVLPGGVDEEWIDSIENGDWRPVDTVAAVKIIENEDEDDIQEWPLSDDTERKRILEDIRYKLQMLLAYNCLPVSLLKRTITYARKKLGGLIPISKFVPDKKLHCLCFLGVSELNNAHRFLEEVFNICDIKTGDEITDGHVLDIVERIVFSSDFKCLLLDDELLRGGLIRDRYEKAAMDVDSDSTGTSVDDASALPSVVDVVDADSAVTCVVDDASAVPSVVDVVHDDSAVTSVMDVDTDCAVTSVVDVVECERTPISDDIIDWLFMYFPIEEQLATWKQLRGDKLGMTEVFAVMETEFLNLKRIGQRKFDISTCIEILQEVESKCRAEDEKMKQHTESKPQSYASLLRKWQQELSCHSVERDGDSTQSRLDAIRNILEEALSRSFKFEEFEQSSKDDDWMMQDFLDEANRYTKEAVIIQRGRLFDELVKIDGMIKRRIVSLIHIRLKILRICVYDYRSIMLPLLKLFIQAHLEDLVDKEAFLEELSLDATKNISEGGDHGKQMQQKSSNKKSKDKRNKKNHRKPMEFKATGGNECCLLDQKDAEKVDVPIASLSADEIEEQEELRNKIDLEKVAEKVDVPVVSVSADELEEQEEKHRNKIELEEVARKQPTETEATEKCLPEKNIMIFGMIPVNMTEGQPHKQLNSEVRSYIEKSQQVPHRLKMYLQEEESGPLPTDAKVNNRNESNVLGTGLKNDFETIKEQEDFSLKEEQKMPEKIPLEGEEFGSLPTDAMVNDKNESIVVGTGLKNDPGEYNCFLNAIIQSLWNLRLFRDEFMAAPYSMHAHDIGKSCVVCALNTIFAYLSISATEKEKKGVDPISLRMALHPSFQEGQMNDASEVLEFIFNFLHQSFTSSSGASVAESEGNCSGSWDCVNSNCLVHRLFGMNILQKMKCDERDFESRKQKQTDFFHNINACELRQMKSLYGDSSFVELLKIMMNHQLTCDSEKGGCGKLHHMHHILSTPPHFFTAVLGWQTSREKVDDISATLRVLTNEIDLGLLYPNLVSGSKHCLVSVVCYYWLHYFCFVYSHENKTWIMYNDEDVKVIGCWGDVLTTCEKHHYQPQVLFFEAIQ